MIDEISSLNRKIAVLKDEFIAIQNDLNSLYWPRLAKIKKKMKDYTWYLLLSVCLFITVIIGVISNIIRNEALIIICLVITFLLVCLLAFVVRRVYKKKEKGSVFRPKKDSFEYYDYSMTIDEICSSYMQNWI